MKTKIIAVGIISAILVLSGCQKIKDALAVKVDSDFSVSLPVTLPSSLLKSTSAAFLSSNTVDPLSDEDLAEYKDKIKGFELTGMTGTVNNLSVDVALTDVKLLVATATQSTEWNFPTLNITNGTVVTFDDPSGQWAKINAILDEQKEITVTLSGNSNQTDVTFTLLVKFSAEVSVTVL